MHRKMLLLFFVLFLVCCSEKREKFVKIDFAEKMRYGKEPGKSGEINSFCKYFNVDSEKNIYIVDHKDGCVKKYGPNGDYLMKCGEGRGKGPGELLDPMGIDIDFEGNLYIAELSIPGVMIFSKEGEYLKKFTTQFLPQRIAAPSMDEVFVIGLPMSYRGDIIYKYDYSGSEAG